MASREMDGRQPQPPYSALLWAKSPVEVPALPSSPWAGLVTQTHASLTTKCGQQARSVLSAGGP